MEVRLFPNAYRPGIGVRPRRESQRPSLQQHARHCPVLEAGSALGFLVYPVLEPHESFYVAYQGEGHYQLVYYLWSAAKRWEPVFTIEMARPVGGIGGFNEQITFMPGVPAASPDAARQIARSLIAHTDTGIPPGAFTLRGAWNFQTEAGWDTVYTPVFNSIERPVAPMLVVRVETDWYAHESEFRYVLEPGEGMSIIHSMPIGQAHFVPREPITVRDCREDEVAAIRESQATFSLEKASVKIATPYGIPYSPHYLRKSRAQGAAGQDAPEPGGTLQRDDAPGRAEMPTAPVVRRIGLGVAAGGPAAPLRKIGPNEPCPCGSGRKYKKCHGRA